MRQTADYACQDEIISPQRAAEIRAERAKYVRRAVLRPPPPPRVGSGSGFFASASGHVVTNRHVVENCRSISILTMEMLTLPARLLGLSADHDLALLDTDAEPTALPRIASRAPDYGANVEIVGYPARRRARVVALISPGRYLGEHRLLRAGVNAISLAATVRGGSSGSPVVDADGQIIGVIFARQTYRARKNPDGSLQKPRPIKTAIVNRALAVPQTALRSFLRQYGVNSVQPPGPPVEPQRYAVRVNCLG